MKVPRNFVKKLLNESFSELIKENILREQVVNK